MRHAMNFHPEWGCLAPAPSLLRTVRTVLIATAIGATAGGVVVLSLVGRSAGQTSVAERTLVQSIPIASASDGAARTARLDDGQVDGSTPNALRQNSPAHTAVVASSAEVRSTPEGALKAAVAPSPAQKHPIHVVQRSRLKDTVSSQQVQHPQGPQPAPSVVERFIAGLTAAIDQVWSPQRLPANRTSRAHGTETANMS